MSLPIPQSPSKVYLQKKTTQTPPIAITSSDKPKEKPEKFSDFFQELLRYPDKCPSDEALKNKLSFYLDKNPIENLKEMSKFSYKTYIRILLYGAEIGYDHSLRFLLELKPFQIKDMKMESKKELFFDLLMENQCNQSLEYVLTTNTISTKEQFFSKALYKSICYNNTFAFQCLLFHTNANPNVIFPEVGSSTIQTIFTLLYSYLSSKESEIFAVENMSSMVLNESSTNQMNTHKLKNCLNLLFHRSDLNLLSMMQEKSIAPSYNCLNYSKYCSYLNKRTNKYLHIHYSFSIHEIESIFQIKSTFALKPSSVPHPKKHLSSPTKTLEEMNPKFNHFLNFFFSRYQFKPKSFDLSIPTSVLQESKTADPESEPTFFILVRLSPEKESFLFEFIPFTEFFRYLQNIQPLQCPITGHALTMLQEYDPEKQNTLVLPNKVFSLS